MFPSVTADLRFALRQLRRSPGFALAAVITLALGIGATTAIFSLVDGILLRPLPFPREDRLLAIQTVDFPPGVAPTNPAAGDSENTSYPDFFDWQRQNQTFVSLASYNDIYRLFSKPDGSYADVLLGGRVSANLFSTLGVRPAIGRDFTPEEELPGHRVVMLSHELWVSQYNSSPGVLGQTAKISDVPYTVIGVMPAGFHYSTQKPGLYWSTFSIDAEGPIPLTAERDSEPLEIVGRLKDGVTPQQALADMNRVQRGLAQQYPEDRTRLAVAMMPLLEQSTSDVRAPLTFLFVSVGVLLLIGCANVAGLLLTRANRRQTELALRTALGAGRIRIIRQLLVEALLLAIAGGLLGIVLACALLRVGPDLVPENFPRLYNATLDGRVLAFAVLLSAATSIVFGLLPAWRMSRQDPAHALRESGLHMTSGRRRNRLHQVLVVAQTALGFTLLVGSGLLIRSFVNVLRIEPGFEMKSRAFFDVALTNARYPVPTKVAYYNKLIPEVAAVPGVERVSAGHPLPILWGRSSAIRIDIANHPAPPDNPATAVPVAVLPGYFETLAIPLVRGRTFVPHDNDPNSARVAVINQSMAQRYFPGEDPIGRYFTPIFEHSTEPVAPRQIIGIVGNTRTSDWWEPYTPQFFLPYAQDPSHQRPLVVMQVAGDPLSYEDTMRKIVARLDPDEPLFKYQTFADGIDEQAAESRFEALLVSSFSAVALLLSALGLYAVLAYVVSERLRELGLRMAFGASRSNILRLVLNRAAVLAGLGVVCGAIASLFTTRFVADLVINVAPLDRSVFLFVTVILLGVSILAAVIPALRAASIDPVRSLREE